MSTLATARPRLSPAEAEEIACSRFGLDRAETTPLPSDRDQNWLIRVDGTPAFVLKIASAAEDRAVLDVQAEMMQRLAACGVPCPRVRPTASGRPIATVEHEGRAHLAWMVTYLPGISLADVNPRTPSLLRNLGRILGRVAACFEGFDPPAAHRDLDWEMSRAPAATRLRLGHIADADRRALIEGLLDRSEATLNSLDHALRRSLVHGDANDHNVLVSPPTTPGRSVAGLIDFGDAAWSYTVADPAIAAAYALLGSSDPVGPMASVAAGFHEAYPLTDDELAVFSALVILRLCLSVAMSADRRRDEPNDAYLSVSEAAAWAALERLGALHPQWPLTRIRAACGLDPFPASREVEAWLEAHRDEIAPIVAPDPSTSPVVVFDFSVGSTDWEREVLVAPMLASDVIDHRMAEAGAEVGIGRYDEPRLVYTGEQFLSTEDGALRTIHLGMDFFQPAGAPVFAPLDATIHSIADNDLPLDYGPTIILEHRPEGGPTFFTLYGHLSHASLDGRSVGDVVRKGELIGTLGAAAENGGWAPHLHFQLITDLFGRRGDFPGVGPASQRAIWTRLCPDPNLIARIPAERFPPSPPSPAVILDARRERLGPSLSVSYEEPLAIVRGVGATLYSETGLPYLDCVNNVCHVGHGHPRVVEAARRQMATLNTNTRYLHPNIVEYAERLTALMPEGLSACFFVNSGSEANDLALRLARAHTNAHGTVVLDGAYHGHTKALIDVSPYKHDGLGGAGAPDWVRAVPMPDTYRGPHRSVDAGERYAEHVGEATAELQTTAHGIGAFIAESLLGCGGQIVLPDGFLAAAYERVRAAGGVCIADEVQVGFGRVGTRMWGFETQGVVPDIVTLGKPIGNGHPLGAVVTTPEIAASFANGMEYFNTYGGNPVSCAVGLAVLDVIEDEGLRAHAASVGGYLNDRLVALAERHAVIGDVRGLGLFLGIDLVLDRDARTPAPEQARYLVERMKALGILLSADGPHRNVIKIKPPLAFSRTDADRLVDTLDRVLVEDFLRVGA